MVDSQQELIPISDLFFDDNGPHIVRRASPANARHTPARGRELQDLIGTTIAQLGGISGSTRKTPVPLPPAVAIESLLYRGRAALDRAMEIRASRSPGQMPDPETLEEIFDLIALAIEE